MMDFKNVSLEYVKICRVCLPEICELQDRPEKSSITYLNYHNLNNLLYYLGKC